MDKVETGLLWQTSSAEPEVVGPLQGDCHCDVAIVGGGYPGLSTALHGAQNGLECHVLEAESIGFGGSGRNVGYVNAGLWLPPQDVYAKLGEDLGRWLVGRLGEMPDYVFSLIEQHQMQCDPKRNGTLHAAHALSGQRNLQRRAEGWQELGAPVELLGPEAAAEKIGSKRFHGALWDHRAGTIDPMGYARGLARAATRAGARVSTGVTVTGLRREAGLWRVITRSTPSAWTRSRVLGSSTQPPSSRRIPIADSQRAQRDRNADWANISAVYAKHPARHISTASAFSASRAGRRTDCATGAAVRRFRLECTASKYTPFPEAVPRC